MNKELKDNMNLQDNRIEGENTQKKNKFFAINNKKLISGVVGLALVVGSMGINAVVSGNQNKDSNKVGKIGTEALNIQSAETVSQTEVKENKSLDKNKVTDLLSISIGVDDVIDVIRKTGNNAKVTSVKTENENGKLVYLVELKDENTTYKFKIDAKSKEVLSMGSEEIYKLTDTFDDRNVESSIAISLEDAKNIAKSKVENSKIKEIYLKDNEEGKLKYEVIIEKDSKVETVEVDSETGEFNKFEEAVQYK